MIMHNSLSSCNRKNSLFREVLPQENRLNTGPFVSSVTRHSLLALRTQYYARE